MNQKKKTTIAFACLASVAISSVVGAAIVQNNNVNPQKPSAANELKSITFDSKTNKFTSGESTQVAYTNDGNPIPFVVRNDLDFSIADGCWANLVSKNDSLDNISYFGNSGKDDFGGAGALHGIQKVDIEFYDVCPKGYFDWKSTNTGSGFFVAFGNSELPLPDIDGKTEYYFLNTSTTTYKPANPVLANYFTIGGLDSKVKIKSITVTYSCYGEVEPEKEIKKVTLNEDTEYDENLFITTNSDGSKEPLYYSLSDEELLQRPLDLYYTTGSYETVYPQSTSPIACDGTVDIGKNQGTSYRKTYLNYFIYEGFQTEPYAINVVDKTLFPTSAGTVFSVKTSEGEKKYIAYINCDDENNRNLKCMPYEEGSAWKEPEEALDFGKGTPVEGEKDTYQYPFAGKISGVDSEMVIYVDYSDYSNPKISIKGNWGKDFDVPERQETEGLTGKVIAINSEYIGSAMKIVPGMTFPLNCEFKTGEKFTDKADPQVVGVKYEVREGKNLIKVSSDGNVTVSEKAEEGDTAVIRVYANTNFPTESGALLWVDIPITISKEVELLPLPEYLIKNPYWTCDLGGVTVYCEFYAGEDGGVTHIICNEAGVDVYGGLYKTKDNTYWFIDAETGNYLQMTLNKRNGYFNVDKCSLPGGEYITGRQFYVFQADLMPDLFRQYTKWQYDDGENSIQLVIESDSDNAKLTVNGSELPDMKLSTVNEYGHATFTDTVGNEFTFNPYQTEDGGIYTEITDVKPMAGYEELENLVGVFLIPKREFPQKLMEHTEYYCQDDSGCYVYLYVNQYDRTISIYSDMGFDDTLSFTTVDDEWNENYATFYSQKHQSVGVEDTQFNLILGDSYVTLDNDFRFIDDQGETLMTLYQGTTFYVNEPAPALSMPAFLADWNQNWFYTLSGGTQTVHMRFWGDGMQIEVGNYEENPDTYLDLYWNLTFVETTETGGRVTFELSDGSGDSITVEYNEASMYTMITSTSRTDLAVLIDEHFKLEVSLPSLFYNAQEWVGIENENYKIHANTDSSKITLDNGSKTLELGYDGQIKESLYQFSGVNGEIVNISINWADNIMTIEGVYKSSDFECMNSQSFRGLYQTPAQFAKLPKWTAFNSNNNTADIVFNATNNTIDITVLETSKTYTMSLIASYNGGMDLYYACDIDGEHYEVHFSGVSASGCALSYSNLPGLKVEDEWQKVKANYLDYLATGVTWSTTIQEKDPDTGLTKNVTVTLVFTTDEYNNLSATVLFDGKSRTNDEKFYFSGYDEFEDYRPKFSCYFLVGEDWFSADLMLDYTNDGQIYIYYCYMGYDPNGLTNIHNTYFSKSK